MTNVASNIKLQAKLTVTEKEDKKRAKLEDDKATQEVKPTGFARGLEAESIMGATEETGQIANN